MRLPNYNSEFRIQNLEFWTFFGFFLIFFLIGFPPKKVIGADFKKEADMTEEANKLLLPKEIVEEDKGRCPEGQVWIIVRCFSFGDIDKTRIATGTNKLQPMIMPLESAVKEKDICGNFISCAAMLFDQVFNKFVPPQVKEKETGEVNFIRPNTLDFAKKAQIEREKTLAQNSEDKDVLAESTNTEQDIKDTFAFIPDMLLPLEVSKKINSGTTQPIPTVPENSPTPSPTPSVSPSPGLPPLPILTPPVDIGIKDPAGADAFKALMTSAGTHFSVPPGIVASIAWIEGPNLWTYDNTSILSYLQEGVKVQTNCNENSSGAAGPMQFILGTWNQNKNAVREAPGQENRNPERCNLMDSVWATANKLKNDSGTSAGDTNWNKTAVKNSGYQYYGSCAKCPLSGGDSELNIGNLSLGAIQACLRFRGKSYCEYMWYYNSCNINSADSTAFLKCLSDNGLGMIR